jgi:hypothetical protein
MRSRIARVRQSGVARAAQDAQHVVLLDRDAVRFDHLREVPLHHRRRTKDADDDLLGGGSERSGLLDLVLERAAASWHEPVASGGEVRRGPRSTRTELLTRQY